MIKTRRAYTVKAIGALMTIVKDDNLSNMSQAIESTGILNLDKFLLENLRDQFLLKLETDKRSANTIKNYKTDLECFKNYLTSKTNTTQMEQINFL